MLALLSGLVAFGVTWATRADLVSGAGSGVPDVSERQEVGSPPARLVDAFQVQACRADVASLETALSTAQTVLGTAPTTLDDLVRRGFLSEAPYRPFFAFTPEVVDGAATGRVLVNGRPGKEGCALPRR